MALVDPLHIKHEKLAQLLDLGMVMVHLDARRDGVSVPPELVEETHLRLNLSYRFKPCDLEISELGVQATLTFGGTPWPCRIPYSAMFGITSHVSGESLIWLEDVPEEVLLQIASEPAKADVAPGTEADYSRAVGHERRRGHLRVVK